MGWNKLATTAYVDAQVQTADSVAELGDTTIASLADHDLLAYDNASSKWINMSKTEAGITQVTVDTALSDGSTNPVTNNAVFDALALKQPLDAQLTTLAGYTAQEVTRGIEDGNLARIDHDGVANDDYAKFTANGLEGRDATQVKTDLGLTVGSDVQAFGAVLDDINTLGAVGADGEVLIGTDGGVLAWESGPTLRTSIGLGTSDSPTFTDLKVTGGDLTFMSSAGTLSASDAGTGSGFKVAVHGGDGKQGNSNLTAGALELAGGQGTGTGAGGDILFKVSPAGPSGSNQNAYQTALTISDDKSATFTGAVTVAGNLDVQGTTTTVNSANTSFTDTSIQLNVADGEAAFGDSASAIVFGDSTGATSTGRIINAGTAAGGFKFMDGNATNTPTGNNNVSDGANYVDIRMRMPVLADVDDTPTVIAGGIWFDGTDIYVGT